MCHHVLATDFYKEVTIFRLDLFSYIVRFLVIGREPSKQS